MSSSDAPGHWNRPSSTIPSVELQDESFLLPHPPGPSARTCLGVGREQLVNKLANLISKLNFYKLIPYPMDNMLNRSAQTGPPNARKRRPVFPPAGRSVVLCTPQMAPRTSFLSRQPDIIASFSLSKPLRPLVS